MRLPLCSSTHTPCYHTPCYHSPLPLHLELQPALKVSEAPLHLVLAAANTHTHGAVADAHITNLQHLLMTVVVVVE